MIRLALTGSLGAGKSTVAEIWSGLGVPVVDADQLAREAVRPGSDGLEEVVELLGTDVLSADGALDRAAVRDLVFSDPEARRALEAIIHPRVWALRESWLARRVEAGDSLVVSEIPLLFETGREDAFDVIVYVDAPESLRLERIRETRGLSEAEARRIMATQIAPAKGRSQAHHVLENGGSREELVTRATRLMEELGGPSAPGRRLRIDLHLHTWASFDCLSDPEQVLEAARARGVERIAITDHNRLGIALEMSRAHPDAVIAGEEVKTAEGIDVIGLYLSEEIPQGTAAAEVCARVHEQGGIAYLPHPFASGKGGGGKRAESLAPLMDVIEVFNARLHPGRLNEPALDLAERHGRLRGAGSDAHTVGEVAGAHVDVAWHPNEAAELLRALAAAGVSGLTTPWSVHLASTWAKVRKRLPNPPGL